MHVITIQDLLDRFFIEKNYKVKFSSCVIQQCNLRQNILNDPQAKFETEIWKVLRNTEVALKVALRVHKKCVI